MAQRLLFQLLKNTQFWVLRVFPYLADSFPSQRQKTSGLFIQSSNTKNMKKKSCSSNVPKQQNTCLLAYLAAGLGASATAMSTADAAIILVNIGPTGANISGINAGMTGIGADTFKMVSSFPTSGMGDMILLSNYANQTSGFMGTSGLEFAVASALPKNFGQNAQIDGNSIFSAQAFLRQDPTLSPNFNAGSYMGFRTSQGNYGWMELTWNGVTDDFQVLAAAYESVSGVMILAGDAGGGSASVPEPSTFAMSALLVGGAAFVRWRNQRNNKRKQAA